MCHHERAGLPPARFRARQVVSRTHEWKVLLHNHEVVVISTGVPKGHEAEQSLPCHVTAIERERFLRASLVETTIAG
jgi:hypothetical protein